MVSAHAVARRDDGTPNDTAECGKRAFFRPDETPMPWPSSHPYKRCREVREGYRLPGGQR